MTNSTSLAIEITSLYKAFGRTNVLRDVNLTVPWGDILTIVGPNGSGKSTLLRILATLTRPDSGMLRVGGIDTARFGHIVRKITGLVAHQPMLYSELTGYENLKFTAKMFGLNNIDEKIMSVSEKLQIIPKLQQRAGALSHGVQKQISLARALLHDPLLLLMDEPDSGLDQKAQETLESVIFDPERPTRTVVMTTHNLKKGLDLGHHLAILSGKTISKQMSLGSAENLITATEAYIQHMDVTR